MNKKRLFALAVGLVSAALFLALQFTGSLYFLEGPVSDNLARISAEPGVASDEVAVVLLDQESLDWAEEAMGLSWPWPRELYAVLTSYMERGGARAVGFDVIYSEASSYGPYDDMAYASALESYGGAVGTVFLSDQYGEENWPEDYSPPTPVEGDWSGGSAPGIPPTVPFAQFPIESLAAAYKALANVQVSGDSDGIYRRVPPVMFFDDKAVPSMALALYRIGAPGKGILRRDGKTAYLDDRRIPLDREGNLFLRFRGPSGTHPTYNAGEIIRSEIQILSGETPQLDPGVFDGKYVLFGFSAPGLLDQRASPMSETYAGVEIHATMLDNLLSGDFRVPVPGADGPWAFLLTLMLIVVAVGASLGAVSVSGALRSVLVYLAFLVVPPVLAGLSWFGTVALPVLPFFGASALSLAGAGIVNYATEGKQRRFIKSAFSQYLSPDVINRLIQNPDRLRLGGERREITIFFSDLQGFTTISEGLEPEGLTALLNRYLTAMAKVIKEEGGTIDKYEGDAIIAFWNAPLDQEDHAVRGIRASLRCQEALAEMRPVLKEMAGGKEMLMRIGMNTGPAVVGNMGSTDRFDYTMFGDSVNLAARLEGVNKQFGTYTMVSNATLNAAKKGGFRAFSRELARVEVVGKSEPVTVYEPMTKEDWEKGGDLWRSFAEALSLFYTGRFSEARAAFASLADRDPASAKYLAKIEDMGEIVPERWKGIWVMTSK